MHAPAAQLLIARCCCHTALLLLLLLLPQVAAAMLKPALFLTSGSSTLSYLLQVSAIRLQLNCVTNHSQV
jgi:hypothetical protein